MSSATTKLSHATEAVSSEVQSLIVEIRKALCTMKTLAVDYEKDGKSYKVQKLEAAALELIASYDDCTSLAEAVQAVPQAYQPSDQMTDFKRLIEAEVNKVKGPHRRRDRTTCSFGSSGRLFGMFTMQANQCLVTNKRTLL